MLEKTYNYVMARNHSFQKTHNWLSTKIDHVLATVVKKKIARIGSYTYKFTDKFMLYLFSVGLIVLLYLMTFYLTQFFWHGYKGTYLGNLFTQEKSKAYLLAEGFFSTNGFFEIISISLYCAIFLLFLLSATRLIFLNRFFYEYKSCFLTSILWGVPLAKFISLHHAGGHYQITPFLDLNLLSFLIPATTILHPTMQFINWLMPEVDDLYKEPTKFWRKLKVERAIDRTKRHNDGM